MFCNGRPVCVIYLLSQVIPLTYFCRYMLFDSWIQTLIGSHNVLQTYTSKRINQRTTRLMGENVFSTRCQNREPEIYRAPLDWSRFNFTEAVILSLMTDWTMSSRKPLLQSVPGINSTSLSNLDSVHTINTWCVRVLIRFSAFFGQNESQRMYKPVKLGLCYTVVRNAEVSLLIHQENVE